MIQVMAKTTKINQKINLKRKEIKIRKTNNKMMMNKTLKTLNHKTTHPKIKIKKIMDKKVTLVEQLILAYSA